MTEKIIYLSDDSAAPRNYTGLILRNNGTKSRWLNGGLHRVDGPAIEWKNGDKEWWLNGKRHREDGPAIEWKNGDKEWWLDGEYYESNDWLACEYIVVERGIPTDRMFGNLKLTETKLLTKEGAVCIYDNLPGLIIGGDKD
jgi:hypothetical protein